MDNVYHFFQRACARPANPGTEVQGNKISDAEGNSALFWIDAAGGPISSIGFRCTTCFTLVALAQHLSELASGMSLEAAETITVDLLLRLHPEIPEERRGRAALAVKAFQSAVQKQHELRGALL